MANYCNNNINIISDGTKKSQKELATLIKKLGKDFDFNKVVPMPKNYDKNEKWYDWSIKNWGCKWGAYDGSVSIEWESEDGIEASFDTPWSPPTEFIKNASKKYPTLTFLLRYYEGGVGFMGTSKAKNGELEDNCMSY